MARCVLERYRKQCQPAINKGYRFRNKELINKIQWQTIFLAILVSTCLKKRWMT